MPRGRLRTRGFLGVCANMDVEDCSVRRDWMVVGEKVERKGGREKAERKGEGESGEEGGGKSGEEGGGLEAAGESDGDTDDGEVFLVDFADLDGGHGVVGGL